MRLVAGASRSVIRLRCDTYGWFTSCDGDALLENLTVGSGEYAHRILRQDVDRPGVIEIFAIAAFQPESNALRLKSTVEEDLCRSAEVVKDDLGVRAWLCLASTPIAYRTL